MPTPRPTPSCGRRTGRRGRSPVPRAGAGATAWSPRAVTGRPAVSGEATASLIIGRDTQAPLDIEHHAAVGVEDLVRRVRPAAEVRDGEQAARLREVTRGGHILVDRPVAVVEEDLLRVVPAEEVEEGLGLLGVLARLGHRDRVLDEDGVVGNRVVDLLTVLLGEDGLVLVGEHRIALAAGEGLQR